MKSFMDHIKAFWNWVVAAWGLFIAWLSGHLPHIDIIAAEQALTEHMRFLTVAGSLALVLFQLKKAAKKEPKDDGES